MKKSPKISHVLPAFYLSVCAISIGFFAIEPYIKGYRVSSAISTMLLSDPWKYFIRGQDFLIDTTINSGVMLQMAGHMILNALLLWIASFLFIKGVSKVTAWAD